VTTWIVLREVDLGDRRLKGIALDPVTQICFS